MFEGTERATVAYCILSRARPRRRFSSSASPIAFSVSSRDPLPSSTTDCLSFSPVTLLIVISQLALGAAHCIVRGWCLSPGVILVSSLVRSVWFFPVPRLYPASAYRGYRSPSERADTRALRSEARRTLLATADITRVFGRGAENSSK